MTTSLDDMMTFHIEWATQVLLDTGSFAPMTIVDSDDGKIPIVAPFTNADEKEAFYKFVHLVCIAHDATAITSLVEAWITTLDADGNATRSEALVVSITRRDGERTAILPIERDPDGTISGVGADTHDGCTIITNRFAELLPKEPVSAYQRDSAKAYLATLDLPSKAMH